MTEFCEDEYLRTSFVHAQAGAASMEREIRYIDWPDGKEYTLQREEDLDWIPQLRVIFAPLDLAGNDALRLLFDRYKIPAAFASERLHAATYGSGSQTRPDGFCSSWFHYLCKSIDVEADPVLTSLQIVDPKRGSTRQADKSNWTWLRGGFVLRWASYVPRRHTAQQSPRAGSVTLICFGGPQSLIERFRGLIGHPEWQKTVQDPYILFVIVFQEIFKEMDQQTWNLSNVFRDMETTTLQKAAEMGKNSARYDFVGLYNIAKHCTYLGEAFGAVLETMTDIITQHEGAQLAAEPVDRGNIQYMLMHEKGLFKSSNFRVGSLNSRIQSIISLSFNLVTQQDSRVMFQDNQTMKAIALITLLFLPMATVATVFGCQFFTFDVSASPPDFRVSPEIWIFFVAVAVVTILMLPLWRMIQFGAGGRTSEPPNASDAADGKEKGKGLPSVLRCVRTKPTPRNVDEAVEMTSTA